MRVLIVGCGVAGLSAGIWFHKAGYDTVILEKNKKKETKLCGGLITGRAINELKLLGIEYNDIIFKPHTINLTDESQELLSFINSGCVYLTDRKIFDERILEKYINIGGRVAFGEKVIDIELKDKKVISKSGREFNYDLLIISNGANNLLRRKLGQIDLSNAICLERKIKTKHTDSKEDIERLSTINVNFLKNKIGYSWIFENNNEILEGIGFIGNNNKIKEEFDRIFCSSDNIKGAFVPFGMQPKQVNSEGIYFIGDAGGYVNPMLAEGISYSIASGRAIYELAHLQKDRTDKKLRGSIRSFYFLRQIFYSKLNIFFKFVIKRKPKFAEYVCKKIILSDDFNIVNLKNLINGYREYKRNESDTK